MSALQLAIAPLRQLLQSRAALVAENLALRHQIVILQRSVKRSSRDGYRRTLHHLAVFPPIRASFAVCGDGFGPR